MEIYIVLELPSWARSQCTDKKQTNKQTNKQTKSNLLKTDQRFFLVCVMLYLAYIIPSEPNKNALSSN